MRNKAIGQPVEIMMPELEIHGKWDRLIRAINHIRHLYWVVFIIILLAIFSIFMPHHIWKDFWNSLKAQGSLLSMLVIFCIISVSLVWTTAERIDVWILKYFNLYGPRPPWLDWLMLCFTQIGNGAFAMVIAIILFFSVDHLLAYELALGTLTLWLVVELMKVIFHRTRPYIKVERIRIVGSRARGYSFPSGHTSQTFFMVALVMHYTQAPAFIFFAPYLIALLVGITRIYVGMHYPRDVLGGAILGTSWGLLGIVVNQYIWVNT